MGDRMHVKRPRPLVREKGIVVPQMVMCFIAVPQCRVEVSAAILANVDLLNRNVNR